jgi:hypothetical protein
MTSRIVVLPTSLPPIMTLTPRDGFHLREVMRRNRSMVSVDRWGRPCGLSHLAFQTCRQAANSEGRIR